MEDQKSCNHFLEIAKYMIYYNARFHHNYIHNIIKIVINDLYVFTLEKSKSVTMVTQHGWAQNIYFPSSNGIC